MTKEHESKGDQEPDYIRFKTHSPHGGGMFPLVYI